MSGRKSRSKGSKFENVIAKALTKQLMVKFRRTPMSGGWAHGFKEVAGDIVCVEPDKYKQLYGHNFNSTYCIECKNVEGWRLETLFSGNDTWIRSWWAQAVRQCTSDDMHPVLVFSKNRTPVFTAVRCEFLLIPSNCVEYISVNVCGEWLTIISFPDFLEILSDNDAV